MERTNNSDADLVVIAQLLLVEDNLGDARLIRELLLNATPNPLQIVNAVTLREAVDALAANAFDAVLLDLGLPDSQGEATLLQALPHAAGVPVVVFTGADDEEMGQQLLNLGAQDYLVKGEVDGRAVLRSVRFATERMRVRDALEQATNEAQAASDAKSRFLATMSHELRTPLNAISGYTQLLKELAEDEGLESILPDLDNIQAAGKQLLDIVNDVLDLSTLESEDMSVSIAPFELADIIQEVVETATPWLENNNNELRVDVDGDLTVYGDVVALRRILLNLLSNAAKFTEDGSVSVTAVADRGRNCLTIAISDTGIGIEEKDYALLFEPFQQVEGGYARRFEGTGLGLAIARRRCRIMGGDIDVRSEPGKGSIFTVTFPIDQRSL